MSASRYDIPDAPENAQVEFWLDILLVNANYILRNIVDPSHNKKNHDYFIHKVKQQDNKHFREKYDQKYPNVFTRMLPKNALPMNLPMLIPDAPIESKIYQPVQFKINSESYADTLVNAKASFITVKG
jgi:hypothetical protein